jgi:hypothetical protein
MILQALRLLCQLALGSLFLVSAAGKFRFPKAFLGSVMDYDLTPLWMSITTAVTLPGIEAAVGAILFAGFLAEFARPRNGKGVLGLSVGLDVSPRPAWLKGLDRWVEAAAWLASAMLVFFMVLLSIELVRGMKLNCGCFDFIGEYIPFLRSSMVSWATVVRDGVMLLLAIPILVRKS